MEKCLDKRILTSSQGFDDSHKNETKFNSSEEFSAPATESVDVDKCFVLPEIKEEPQDRLLITSQENRIINSPDINMEPQWDSEKNEYILCRSDETSSNALTIYEAFSQKPMEAMQVKTEAIKSIPVIENTSEHCLDEWKIKKNIDLKEEDFEENQILSPNVKKTVKTEIDEQEIKEESDIVFDEWKIKNEELDLKQEDIEQNQPKELTINNSKAKYKNPNNYKFNCECGRNFNLEKNFKAHKKKVHDTTDSSSRVKGKNCSLCNFKSNLRPQLIKHFETTHDLSLVQEEHVFESKEQFLIWKNEVESKTLSRFVQERGYNKFKTHVTSTYVCHRSGYYTPVGKGKRNLKIQGSAKINGFCPARITLKVEIDGRCHVLYTASHIGHNNELKHLALTPAERENIANKISLKIPFDDILDQIRDPNYDSDLQKIHILTRQDLYNIETSFNLNSKAVRQKDDALSVDSWVKQMQAGDQDCVMFYKPRGICLDEISNFKLDDFILMIMTPAQLDILKQYGSDCTCLDVIHCIPNCDFELNTLLVLDKLREGFPCAFLISNRSDTEVMQFFFSKVKERAGLIKPKIFMSDLADTFFNAWIAEMGMPEKRLFCTWHVDQCWRKNLLKIKGKEAQIEVYKHLRTLLMEPDSDTFHKMLTEFCNIDNPEYSGFIKYFRQHYTETFEHWAYCYRLCMDVKTNMHLERMHRSLKYMYLGGRNVKTLDKAIIAIMTFVRDKLINEPIVIKKGKLSSKVASIKYRHKSMEKMDTSKVSKTVQGWEVLAVSGFEMCSVQKKDVSCNNCMLVCSECEICIHQFQCSCFDSAIKYNMCKHIHLVAKLNKLAEDGSQKLSVGDS